MRQLQFSMDQQALRIPATAGFTATRLQWWQPVLFGALAGGMGWGIRGQYGHETGAMIAGLLLSLVLTHLFRPQAATLPVARAVAWCTVAIGFGGSMTYGQTIGLTQDAPLIGNWAALGWGLLGLAVKGGIWFGFAGVFLGMGLSGQRYRPLELCLLMAALVGLLFVGKAVLNAPFDPANKLLPPIYFSADWRWQPEAALKPRPEIWGGLLLALVGLFLYVAVRRRDVLARNLGLWAVLGGVVGFPLGQSFQAFHAWNRDAFSTGIWAAVDPLINWWNLMEIAFGATAGAFLGLGLWFNRHRLGELRDTRADGFAPWLGWALLALHATLLVGVEFQNWPWVDAAYDLGLVAGIIPMVAIAGSWWWPYVLILPLTLLPIAGKTLKALAYEQQAIGLSAGWTVYLVLPLILAAGVAAIWSRNQRLSLPAHRFTSSTLLLATWLYFGVNFALFRFPWPWEAWTQRTPSAIVLFVCAIGLSYAALNLPGSERGAVGAGSGR